MTGRTTITRGWRPAAPSPRYDDFDEVAAETTAAPAPDPQPDAPRAERRSIASRLENWGRWATSSEVGRSAACMTGAICEAMRKAKEGAAICTSVEMRSIDTADAVLIGRAMVHITLDHRRLLGMYYIDGPRHNYSKGFIAALLRFPPLEFNRRVLAAQIAIEDVIAMKYQNSNSQ